MKITVTREDIDAGRKRDPYDCAVAKALRRAGVAHYGVAGTLVLVKDRDQRRSVVLPAAVQEWIVDFDWGVPVQPFEFDLCTPCEAERKTVVAPETEPLLPLLDITPGPAESAEQACPCCGTGSRFGGGRSRFSMDESVRVFEDDEEGVLVLAE